MQSTLAVLALLAILAGLPEVRSWISEGTSAGRAASMCNGILDNSPYTVQNYSVQYVNYFCKIFERDFQRLGVQQTCQRLSQAKTAQGYYERRIAADLLYRKNCGGGSSSLPECGVSSALVRHSRGFGRIVGGSTVQDCSVIPWQVRLDILQGILCGGSILSDRHILTASHCLEKVTHPSQVVVSIADHDMYQWDEYEKEIRAKNVSMHPDYSTENSQADIAILTLSESISFENPCVRPICLDPTFNFDGMDCTVSGWGALTNSGPLPEKLQMVQVRTHEGHKCDSEFGIDSPWYMSKREQQVCAGLREGGKDSCVGDSGGPLVCLNRNTQAFVQVGVVSYGGECAAANLPGVYASVPYFHEWILRVMKEN